MKDCKFKDKIIDYIEGLMDTKDRFGFDNHLKTCESCQRELLAIKKVYEIMNKDEVPVIENEFFEKLKLKVRQEEIDLKPRRMFTPMWRIFGVLVPAFAVLLFIIFLNTKNKQTVEISISISSLMQDENLNVLLLDRIVDEKILAQFSALEEYFQPDIDESIDEFTSEETKEFMRIIHNKYGDIQT